jgi:uncharacterized membrane protein YdjX (TVP38/TMEM64 family)
VIEKLTAAVQSWQEFGVAGLAGLALIFALGALTFLPRFTFYAIGGLVFGFAAIPAAVIGTTAGAAIAFLLARTTVRTRVMRAVETRPRWRAILAAVDAEGWRLVFLFRISSPLPGGLINYLFGLTGIGLAPYVIATAAGLLAPVTLFASLGMIGRMAIDDVGQSRGQVAVLAAGIIVLALAILLVLRRLRAIAAASDVRQAGIPPA